MLNLWRCLVKVTGVVSYKSEIFSLKCELPVLLAPFHFQSDFFLCGKWRQVGTSRFNEKSSRRTLIFKRNFNPNSLNGISVIVINNFKLCTMFLFF